MDELAERAMRSGRRIGLVIGCLSGSEQRVVGYGHTGTKDRPDGATIFEIGSVTKVFTGLLLAGLAEQGLVGPDDPLGGYLPAWVRVPIRGGRQLTLGDLASHAGGLPRDPKGTLGRWLARPASPYQELVRERICVPLGTTCWACCGPTSLPAARWPPRSSVPSSPGSRRPNGWGSGSAG